MKRFLALLATGALGLGLTTSAHAQTRGFAAGAFILDDLQPTPHTIIMTTPGVGTPEWQKWQDDGFPSLTMSIPVPPYDGAQAGFIPAGPNAVPPGKYIAYWIPAHGTGLHGHQGGHAGSWDWATMAELGGTTGTGTPNQITKFDATGTAVTNSSLSDDGTTVTTAANMVLENLLTLGSDAPVRGTIALHDATAANGFTVNLEAPYALAGNLVFKLPSTDGAANTALITDGAGNLTFGSPISLGGENYVTLTGATITAHPVDLSGSNATGLLKATSFPALTGDVTSAGGSLSTTVASVGGVTAANVASGANAANAATNLNTASTIVKRDASGNFAAGTITAALTGNVTGNVSGNAGTATALQTSRNINGVAFDGTSDINISAAPSGSAGGDLGGTYPNPSVNSVGGLTAATIAAGVNLANAATDANTASTIVKRDASGNFTAGTITASLTGNASTATALQTARNINGVSFDGTGDINITAPPSGAAGGDLTGSYPSPTLTTTGVTAGTYGTGTSVAQVTVDAKGRVTSVTDVTITGAAPTGAASGDLSGNYPNPDVATVGGVTAANVASGANAANAATNLNTASTIVKRDASGNFAAGTITASLTGNASTATALQTSRNINGVAFDGTSDINITAAPSGAAGGDLTGSYPSPTLTATTVTAGSYGSATSVATFTVDSKGRLTAAGAAPIIGLSGGSLSLTDGKIFVGDGSNTASEQTMSGDATISNTGVMTLANSGATAGSYGTATTVPAVTVDAKGRVTSVTTNAITGLSGSSLSLTNGKIFVGDGSNAASEQTMSGDATISNTGALTLANSGATAGTYGTATTVPAVTVDAKGRVTSVTTNAISGLSASSLSLADTKILVGNAGTASEVSLSGDATIANTGALTLANSGATAGTYGSGTSVAQVTVDAKGRVTSVTDVTITGAAPTGAASGDLSGNYPNPTVASVGGVTAANVASGANAANAATNLNTASTIVKRDASGNFAAGTITASLTGNASTATALQTSRNINGVAFDGTSDINITAAPSGAAGGDLTGSYPSPTLTATTVTAGSYGSATSVATFTVDSKGRLTAAGAAPIIGLSGGSLSLTDGKIFIGNGSNAASEQTMSGDASISNTGVMTLANSGATAGTYGTATTVPAVTVDAKGRVTSVTTNAISGLSASSLSLADTKILVGNAGTASEVLLSGDATIANTGAMTLANTGVTANSYGSSSSIPTFTVDAKGRLTAAASTSISGLSSTSLSLTDGKILIGDGTNTSAAQTMSGDVTMTNTGATTIGASKVTSAKIADNEILDADINASAAIAGTKISPNFGAQAVTTSGNISTTGTGSITAAGNLVASSAVQFHQRNDATAATVPLAATDYYVKLTNAATTGFSFPAPLGGGQQVMVTNSTGAALTTGDAAIPNGETWQFIFDGSSWKFIQ